MGCPISIEGKENIQDELKTIYVANHASYIDSIVLLAILPSTVHFVGKKEVLKAPLFKTIFKKLRHLTVDRVDFSASIKDAQSIEDILKQGGSIAIFPEGTFTYASGIRSFKMGAFKVAIDTMTPICPIAIVGTRNILRGDEWLFTPGKIKVIIESCLTVSAPTWEQAVWLQTQARKIIADHSGEQMIEF
jgi:1-acyl-sn-glycerol-3-phosphate acyltransferase